MKNKKSGQIALVVLLMMVVLLTIGLSLISHSITDVSISQDEKEAMRAFSAAEAGIEDMLREVLLDEGTWTLEERGLDIGEGITGNIDVTEKSDDITRDLKEGEFTNINLEGADNGTILIVSWSPAAALEIVFYKDDYTTSRQAVTSSGPTCVEGFTNEGSEVTLPAIVSPDDQLIRIRALCNATTVTITVDSGSLPAQEYAIESRAAAGSTEESKVSAIEVTKESQTPPSIFDYVLFSGGNLE